MIKSTKKIKQFINILPIIGIIFISGGTVVAFVVLNTRNQGDWLLYYFQFKIIGAVLAYFWASQWFPGGLVTMKFDKSALTLDEKNLYNLVIKYRSNILIFLPLICYILLDFIIGKEYRSAEVGSFEGYFTQLLIGFFIILMFSNGFKYISAWVNIKRNWKKEFGTKK